MFQDYVTVLSKVYKKVFRRLYVFLYMYTVCTVMHIKISIRITM